MSVTKQAGCELSSIREIDKISIKNGKVKNTRTEMMKFGKFWWFYEISFAVVCLEKDRDILRSKLLSWIKTVNIVFDVEGKSYRSVLKDLFLVLDENNDTKLDTMEFIKLLEGNESVSEVFNKIYFSLFIAL